MSARIHATEAPAAGDLLFGRYRVVGEIGRGGMGVVLLARDQELNTDVAVKLVPDLIVQDREGLEELKHEVLRGMALTHPNIVRTHGFERDARMAAIIMEFVDGGNFIELKHAHPGGCMDASKLLPWLEQLCPVLDYAHFDIRIAHRDLKPHNLMYSAHGRLKVADFGISSTLNETGTRITMRDASSGTPAYMSPQQVMGERASHLDDIYSLGVTIYELLTGKPPFYQGQILAQVLESTAVPMTLRRDELGVVGKEEIPALWEQTVAACLAKNAADRPQSAGEVLARLTGVQPVATPVPAVAPVRRKGSGKRWGAGIAASAVLVGAGLWFQYHRSEMEPVLPDPPAPMVTPVSTTLSKPLPEAPQITAPAELPDAMVGEVYRFSLSAEGGQMPYSWSTDGTLPPDGLDLDSSGVLSGIPTTPSRGGFVVMVTGGDGEVSRLSVTLVVQAKPQPKVPVPPAPPEMEEIPDPVVQMILATKEEPYLNSLGMEFVPAGTPEVLFSRFLTRVMDFKAFVDATRYDATQGVLSVEEGGKWGFFELGKSWEDPGFAQDVDDPVCGVSWHDAVAFCRWLTTRERRSGELDPSFEYRLPTDVEWLASLGVQSEPGNPARFPWGNSWPPPLGRGNLAGLEMKDGGATPKDWPKINIRDHCPRTSRVDRFQANDFGIHDFYGNLWQYCSDIADVENNRRLMRGGSWATSNPDELRIDNPVTKNRPADWRYVDAGFRCVLARIPSP